MKLIHTADLHIGKIVNEFSMLRDQEYMLQQIVAIVIEEKADGLLIAGDIYDRSIPPAEAVAVLDLFLTALIKENIPVMMISGNHDSPERIGFASEILEKKGLYIAGPYMADTKKVTMEDEYGKLNVYLLPFAKPPVVRYMLEGKGGQTVSTYEDSVRESIKRMELEHEERNVLVTHHFVTNAGTSPELSGAETGIMVGGVDNVDASVFDNFDYVALGHIHRPQMTKRESIRYAGSPLKYSFSECLHHKSVSVIEIKEKGCIKISTREIKPLHDMRKIKGSLKELMKEEIYSQGNTNDYIHATLTDKEELIDPIGTLRSVYRNVMQLVLEKNIRNDQEMTQSISDIKHKSTLDIYQEFYEGVTTNEFDERRRNIIAKVIEEVEGAVMGSETNKREETPVLATDISMEGGNCL